MYIVGFRVTYNLAQPVGFRVTSVYVRCSECSVPSFEPLDHEQWYNVFINNFMYNGGDGYSMFQAGAVETRYYGIC